MSLSWLLARGHRRWDWATVLPVGDQQKLLSNSSPVDLDLQNAVATLPSRDILLWLCGNIPAIQHRVISFSSPENIHMKQKTKTLLACKSPQGESAWGKNGVLYVALLSTSPQSRHHLQLSPESCWPTSVLHPSIPPSTSALHVAQRRPRPRLTFAAVCRQALSSVPSEGGGRQGWLT